MTSNPSGLNIAFKEMESTEPKYGKSCKLQSYGW